MIERRRAKRFQIDWQVRVESGTDSADGFVESGVLRNLSSSGALLSLSHPLSEGATLDLYIKLPLQGTRWMKYSAQVVRVESGVCSAAVKFDATRPDFRSPLVPVS